MTVDATTRRERIGVVLFYSTVAVLAYLAYRIFEPFLEPLAWAAILVVLTFPMYKRVTRRFRPGTAALLTTAGVTLLLIVPMTLVLSAFVKQAVNAVHTVQLGVELGRYAWVNRLWSDLQHRFPALIPSDFGTVAHNYAEQAAGWVAGKAGSILKNTATFVLDMTFTIFAMYYFYRDGATIVMRIRNRLPFEEEQRDRVMDDTHSLVFATVFSTLAAAVMHGSIGALTFALTGIDAPIFWGVLMGFFSFIPMIGTALIWVPLALSLLLGGHVVAGIVLAVVCSTVIGTIDSFIRPYIISGRAEMNMLLVFIGVLGGIEVFGLLGVVLGPIVIAMAGTLLQVYVPRTRFETKLSEAAEQKKAAVLE
ncbi:MAG TPA: AI-2E family transporter [Candidatus Acidoferrales bacterium]|nr:AI-2E family transporter [Candidatus Acidoferrales bacterium]